MVHTCLSKQQASDSNCHNKALGMMMPPPLPPPLLPQASQFKLADMATRLQASRLMVRHAATALDAKVCESVCEGKGA
jgi:hypothetical protein